MPKKININKLSVAEAASGCEVLSLFTYSKKSHFLVPMAKLYDSISWHIDDGYNDFRINLSVYPYIAVHIHGEKEILAREKEALIAKVVAALTENFDDGRSKIKGCVYIDPNAGHAPTTKA